MEPPGWVWLCSFPAAALRLPADVGSEDGDASRPHRQASRLRAASPRLLEQFVQAGCLAERNVWGATAVAQTCTVEGLIRVRPGEMWDGPLSQWPASADLQRRYFNRAADAYYIDVLEVRRLQKPRMLFTRRDGCRGRIVSIQLRPSSMLFDPCGLDGRELVSGGGGAPGCQAQHLAGWPALPATIMALQVAHPCAMACLSGSWTKLVLLARWSGTLWPSCPQVAWRRIMSGQQEQIRERLFVRSSAEPWAEAANALRSWAPAVLASQDGGPVSAAFLATRGQLEDLCSLIEFNAEVADQRSRRLEDIREQRRWGSAELQICWQAASLMKKMRALPEAVRLLSKAVTAAIPAALATGCRPCPPEAAAPSEATLSRLNFAVDVAAMLLARANARPGATRYGWADSSPQGGRDWLLSKVSVIPGDVDLCDLHDAAIAVAKRSSSPAISDSDSGSCSEDAQSDVEKHSDCDVDQRRVCFQKLQAGLSEHVFPPVALGLRQSDLAHKCAAFVHCVALEVSPSRGHLEEALSSVVSFTTDMGTELGMSGFRLGSLSGLLPVAAAVSNAGGRRRGGWASGRRDSRGPL